MIFREESEGKPLSLMGFPKGSRVVVDGQHTRTLSLYSSVNI